jgi:predicted DNA-binding transcriptional regulator AlpA
LNRIEQLRKAFEDALRTTRHLEDFELVGVAEAAALLGWSRMQVHRYKGGKAGFPAPLQELACGPVWLKKDIAQWGEQRAEEAEEL